MNNMNFFEKAVKIIDKYGIYKVFMSISMVALFIFAVYGLPIWIQNGVKKEINIIDQNRENTHLNDIAYRRNAQPQVYEILKSLRNRLDADRAYIIELHNGSQNINAIPFLHGSVTYETTRQGLEAIDEEYQNVSLSRFEFSSYIHEHYNFVGSVDDIDKIDSKFASKLRSNGIDYVCIVALHENGREWGWFGVVYNDRNKVPSNDDILSNMVIASQSISARLTK